MWLEYIDVAFISRSVRLHRLAVGQGFEVCMHSGSSMCVWSLPCLGHLFQHAPRPCCGPWSRGWQITRVLAAALLYVGQQMALAATAACRQHRTSAVMLLSS